MQDECMIFWEFDSDEFIPHKYGQNDTWDTKNDDGIP